MLQHKEVFIMSDAVVSYPTNAMKQTAGEIRTILDQQWSQHTAFFRTNSSSFSSLTTSLANSIPGGKGQALHYELEQWKRQMQSC